MSMTNMAMLAAAAAAVAVSVVVQACAAKVMNTVPLQV
jgi:hypothetical protein